MVGDKNVLYASGRSEKLALLSQPYGSHCSAFFGSSRVHNGFKPEAFDNAMAAGGRPLASLNLAIEGGSQTEQYYMARTFLTRPGAEADASGDCLLMLELNAGVNFQVKQLSHPRSINIYDLGTVSFVTDFVSPGMSLTQSLGRVGYAMLASTMYYANVGMLANRLFPAHLDQSLMLREGGAAERGYLFEPPTSYGDRAVQAIMQREHGTPAPAKGVLSEGNFELIERLRALPGGKHSQFVYVVTPTLSDLDKEVLYPDCISVKDGTVPIVNMARPSAYPELYNAKLWHDPGHLNSDGATLYSQLLAKAVLQLGETPASSAHCSRL